MSMQPRESTPDQGQVFPLFVLEKTSCPLRNPVLAPGIESEEERAWVGFYRRVGRDPAIATEVMGRVRSRRPSLALYLCCKESCVGTRPTKHATSGSVSSSAGCATACSSGRCAVCRRVCVTAATSPSNACPKWSRSRPWPCLARETEFTTAHTAFEQQAARPVTLH
jgi:hypothetical protein